MANSRDRDPVDAWLSAEVEPLTPPPGTFERIRHRARRRRAGRVVMSAAGIAIVIAAAVAIPRISSTVLHSHNRTRPTVAEGASPSARPSATRSGNESSNAASPTPLPPPTSSLSPVGTSGEPVPRNFQPTSVTFVSQASGAVIGQAGTPGHCGPPVRTDCTSLAGTSDYGTTWYGVSAPVTGAPDGSSGVSQLRFLNARDGWAFGPELWVTHDGGAHWKPEQTHGMRVTDLETANGQAFAIFASCSGTGLDYAADCSSFSLYTSPAEGNGWQPVPVLAAGMQRPGTGGGGSASLVLAGGTGYLLAPSGELLSGPLTGAGWTVASPLVVSQHVRCLPGAPGADGQPTGTLLAANASELVLVCTSATSPADDTQAKLIVESRDAGAHWSTIGAAPRIGIATSLAGFAQDNLVLATDAGIYLSTNGGSAWQRTQPSPGGAAPGEHGFSFVGMTSPTKGVALPADASLHEVFITTDGGISWLPRAVSAP